MGGSRRRLKKHAPKVKVAVLKRSRKQKAPVPAEIAAGRPGVPEKLGRALDWEQSTTVQGNYSGLGLCSNANRSACTAHTARAAKQSEASERSDRAEDERPAQHVVDVDLRAALGHQVCSQPVIDPLTAHQRRVIERLIARHGSDVAGMVRDRKLNQMLLTAGKLRRMMRACETHAPGSRVKFQQPKKGL